MPKHWPNVVGSFVKIFEEASNMQVKGTIFVATMLLMLSLNSLYYTCSVVDIVYGEFAACKNTAVLVATLDVFYWESSAFHYSCIFVF
jgi:hypothetical protein